MKRVVNDFNVINGTYIIISSQILILCNFAPVFQIHNCCDTVVVSISLNNKKSLLIHVIKWAEIISYFSLF